MERISHHQKCFRSSEVWLYSKVQRRHLVKCYIWKMNAKKFQSFFPSTKKGLETNSMMYNVWLKSCETRHFQNETCLTILWALIIVWYISFLLTITQFNLQRCLQQSKGYKSILLIIIWGTICTNEQTFLWQQL